MDERPTDEFLTQLRRQSIWLKESWRWLLETKVLVGKRPKGGRNMPTALDVGCGPGFVMDLLKDRMDIQGVDMDKDMVSMCKVRNLRVVQGLAEDLPFDDGRFDIVYCSFLLLLVKNPLRVIREMKRVSKGWVLALAEPDYGAWIDHPDGLDGLGRIICDGIIADGGDPFIGRKLRSLFKQAGLEAHVGAHPGVWDLSQLREEFQGQRSLVRALAGKNADEAKLRTIEMAWKAALDKGEMFHYNPIFYALARL